MSFLHCQNLFAFQDFGSAMSACRLLNYKKLKIDLLPVPAELSRSNVRSARPIQCMDLALDV